MTPPQLVCLLIFFSVLIVTVYFKSDPISPAKIFTFLWTFVIFLTEFKFSRFQHEWTFYSWIALVVGLISFLVGVFVVYTVYADKKILSLDELRTKFISEIKFNTTKFYSAIIVLFFLYVFAYMVEVALFGSVPILSAFPDKARSEFAVFGVHLLVSLQPAIMFFCIQYLFLNRNEKKKKLVIWSIFFYVLITYFFLLQRFYYFFTLVIVLSFLYYTTKVINWKKILITVGAFAGLITFLQSIRLSRYANQFFYVISDMKYSKEYASFTGPYMYITMNLENYASSVEKIKEHSFGLLTFDWLMALTGIKHWAAEYFNVEYKKYVVTIYNTYPYLWDFFYDFGFFGITFLSMALGGITAMVYFKMRTSPHIKWVSLYSAMVFIMIMSFFTNAITMLNMVANLIVIFVVNSFFLQESD